MRSLSERRNILCQTALVFLTALAFLSVVQIAYAAGASGIWSGTENGGWDMTGYRDKIMSLYNIMKGISLPLGTVSFAGGAMKYMVGNQNDQAKGLNQMRYTVFAVAVIALLPEVITLGYEAVSSYIWDPFNPTSG